MLETPAGNAESRTWADAQFGAPKDQQTRLDLARLKGAIDWLEAVDACSANVVKVL